ncbi:MAG: hypothetical protein AB7E85_08035 [Pseudobdellovibrionaceae bacterium]
MWYTARCGSLMAAFAPITEELREELNAERMRTGIGPTELMRGTAHDPKRPATLKGHAISRWLTGTITSARPSHIAYVLDRWRCLPDATTRKAREPAERVVLNDNILCQIDAFWEQGLLPDKIFHAENVPEGLNAAIIRTWKDRRIKTAARDYIEFVIRTCTKN